MSEEEKKAIETLEIEGTENNYLEVKILLNLVDKQQKEIEEKTTIIMAGAEKVKQLEKDYISKDKIREKIKELEDKSDYWNCDEIQVLQELLEEN